MSDRDTRAAGLSTGYPTAQAPVPAPEGTLGSQPPPYSACVPHPPTITSNYQEPHSATPTNPSEASPLTGIHHNTPVTGPIQYGTASTASFLAVSPGSENRHDGCGPGSKPYSPQPSYNPSYMTDSPTTSRRNVYGKKTIVLNRTDGLMTSSKTKQVIGLCIALAIASIVFWGIYFRFYSEQRDSSSKTVKNYGEETNNNLQHDVRVFTTPRHTTAQPFLTDKPKNKYDDTYWSNKISDTQNYPFLDDKYVNTFTENSWRLKTREEILREVGIPDFSIYSNPVIEDTLKALRDLDVKFDEPANQPDTMGSEMKDEIKKKKPRVNK